MHLTKVISLLFIAVLTSSIAFGQTRHQTTNNNGWIMYFGNHKLSGKFGVHAEVQFRRHELFSENQQLLLRGGIEYYLKNNSRFTLGYGFVKTYPYGEFAAANAFPEHRIWQQFLTGNTVGSFKLTHRYRLEQRIIGNASTGELKGGRYENRVRYMLKVTTDLTKEWKRKIFAAAYDEVFVNFGKDVAYNIFDQNRLYGALGLSVNPTWKIEIGYLYQVVQLRSLDVVLPNIRNKVENNHTFQIGVFHSIARKAE